MYSHLYINAVLQYIFFMPFIFSKLLISLVNFTFIFLPHPMLYNNTLYMSVLLHHKAHENTTRGKRLEMLNIFPIMLKLWIYPLLLTAFFYFMFPPLVIPARSQARKYKVQIKIPFQFLQTSTVRDSKAFS